MFGRAKNAFIRCHHGFSRSRNGAVNMHAVSLPAHGHRRLAAPGRRCGLRAHRDLPAGPHADRRARRARPLAARARPVAARPDPGRRGRRAERRPAGHRDAGAEHQPRGGLPGTAQGPPRPGPRRPVPLRARAVHDRDGRLRRHRAAGDDVPGARRLLHRVRTHRLPGREEGRRAARPVPGEPLRDLRARAQARREPPGLPR